MDLAWPGIARRHIQTPIAAAIRRCSGPGRSVATTTRTITQQTNIPQPDRGAPRHRRTAGQVYQEQYVRPLHANPGQARELDRRRKSSTDDPRDSPAAAANLGYHRGDDQNIHRRPGSPTGVTVAGATAATTSSTTPSIDRGKRVILWPLAPHSAAMAQKLSWPVFKAAGFRLTTRTRRPATTAGRPELLSNRDDGVTINLVNGDSFASLCISYDTGCRSPDRLAHRAATCTTGQRPERYPLLLDPRLDEPATPTDAEPHVDQCKIGQRSKAKRQQQKAIRSRRCLDGCEP